MTDNNNNTAYTDDDLYADGLRSKTPAEKARTRSSQTARRPSAGTRARRKAAVRQRKPITLSSLINDRRLHVAIGVALVISAVVLLAMTFSHLRSGAADQSMVESRTMTEITQSGTDAVQNVGGAVGAKTTHMLATDGLGLGMFMIVIWLGGVGLALLGALRIKFWAFSFKCLLTAVTSSIILGVVAYSAQSAIHWGGVHGRSIAHTLYTYGGTMVAWAVALIFAGFLVAAFLHPLKTFFGAIADKLTAARERRELRRKRRMEARRQERFERKFQTALPEADTEDTPEYETVAEVTATVPENQAESAEISTKATDDKDIAVSETDNSGFSIDDEIASVTDAGNEANGEVAFSIKVADVPEADNTPENHTVQAGSHLGLDTDYDPRADLSRFVQPSVDLLIDRPSGPNVDVAEQNENKEMIVETLKSYNIPISSIEATVGPTVTLYEIVPAEGVRIAKIKSLEDDIALSLSALGIRIIAPIPGKGTVGIEVPNREPQTVSIRSVLSSRKFKESKAVLPIAMGNTISNQVFVEDLTRMPHLLVAGATGQGKSVGLNCIIASLLFAKHPAELKFVLIDPKMVEFSLYSRIENHYLAKLGDEEEAIITDPQKAADTLQSLCVEMDNRYALLRDASVRSIEEYNRRFVHRQLNPENGHKYLPYIVIVVDEFADLIMTGGKEISINIARIAQKARAVGMHMIIATQRPSTDVITGMIKANFPGRIAFRVSQMVDSKTILDRPGANQLIGRGDMLFSHNGKLERVQCAFIDTEEVENIVKCISDQMGYSAPYPLPEVEQEAVPGALVDDPSKRDARFNDCARFVSTLETTSVSILQRRFGIGYNKAGKIMDQLEAAGIVGPAQGQKPRAVLVDATNIESYL
ncbi:MAG: DNA translocase FtsK [Muribaculaceae bacterium]|nr:DNA translocase FtsK [Muribaculaceae bacterium]